MARLSSLTASLRATVRRQRHPEFMRRALPPALLHLLQTSAVDMPRRALNP